MNGFRAYFFNNMYLTGIHNGIQAGHALDQLWSGFVNSKRKLTKIAEAKFALLREFSNKHKTWVILKHGDHDAVSEFHAFLAQQTVYPFTMFQEPGLNYSATSVVVILPERMYDEFSTFVGRAVMKSENDKTNPGYVAAQIPDDMLSEFVARKYSPWELDFLKRKCQCGLAS
jgi:hypothetical protein